MRCPHCDTLMEKRWYAPHFAIAPVLRWCCNVCQHTQPVEQFIYERSAAKPEQDYHDLQHEHDVRYIR